MHEEAILTTGNAILGSTGSQISISVIEKHFPTTTQANAGINYKCSDPNCGVRVKAIIPEKKRAGRKASPSSYFSARWGKHKSGCMRDSRKATRIPSSAPATKHASPNRLDSPTIWIDPRKSSSSASSATATNTSNQTATASSGGISSAGQNTSLGQSETIERFARAWGSMSLSDRQSRELRAPWNKGGTYFSGFFPLWFNQNKAVDVLGELIFVGRFASIVHGTSGFTVTLAERHMDGSELKIWIKNVAFSIQPGGPNLKAVFTTLLSLMPTHNFNLYALGSFSKQTSKNGQRSWYALPIEHPHLVWPDL